MAHWDHRPEPKWEHFKFNQPYAKGRARLEQLVKSTDFDPLTLWQWGTMQSMALVETLRACESQLGPEGRELVFQALRKVGLDVGRQILDGVEIPPDVNAAELVSFYVTVVNRIAFASIEEPRIDNDEQVSFDIVWCPHQDEYSAFDCRVQHQLVQGMMEAARERLGEAAFDLRFDTTIPAGAMTCHVTLRKAHTVDPSKTSLPLA